MVERFDFDFADGEVPIMERSAIGEYVRYSDYADLQRQIAEIQAERDELATRAAVIDEALTNAIHMRHAAEAERDRLAAENEALKRMAFWFAKYPELKPSPEMIDEVCADIELARPFIPSARAALDTAKGAGK